MKHTVLSLLLDLIFPPRCIFCRKLLKDGEKGICRTCLHDLPFTQGGDAVQTGSFFSVCVSPLYYSGTVRESLLRFKFAGASQYAGYYGKLLADAVREHLSGRYDLITWVPLSEDRMRRRGYDQAMLLALATSLNLDDVAVETLKKIVDTPMPDPDLVSGKRVVLIDHIITTGSTLSECARTLLAAGASEVVCAALARSEKK
jgi:predicted amidophosphoribosyltransferase